MLGTAVGTREQSDRSFDRVVVEFDAAVIDETR